jgi:hypothetical protein
MRKGGSRVTLEQRAFLRFDSQQAKPRVKAWYRDRHQHHPPSSLNRYDGGYDMVVNLVR